jgi:hypothetical protein
MNSDHTIAKIREKDAAQFSPLMDLAVAEMQRATRGIIEAVAVDALSVGVGGRLPTSAHYREKLDVGAGTVQRAIDLLVSAGAFKVTARGHLGRIIDELRVERLWHMGSLGPIRAVLPPRGPVEVRSIAQALSELFTKMELPFSIIHVRGAAERVALINSGKADIAAVSSGVVTHQLAEHKEIRYWSFNLGHFTYYDHNRMHVLEKGAVDLRPIQTRVAIDQSSLDHARFTKLEFPEVDGYQYVDIDFPRVPVAILDGRVDVGVWHEMQTLITPQLAGLQVRPLRNPSSVADLAASSSAVVLVSSARPELRSAIVGNEGDLSSKVQVALRKFARGGSELLDSSWTV